MAVVLVGVLNVTPDSFSDGGQYLSVDAAVAAGLALAEAGAGWIDIGGESTRPGASPVSEAEERRRVLPVLAGLAKRLPGQIRLCVDTYKSGTARAALDAGATVVNDVSGGLLDADILNLARPGAALVLGHVRGRPATMMNDVHFTDVVAEVGAELHVRVQAARDAGWAELWADPGIGFGKHLDHNLALLRGLPVLARQLAVPLLVGVSRKRFVGELTGKPVEERLMGSAAAVTAAILGGARAVRVHDVAAMKDVAAVASAIAVARKA